jgi:hypothetical protein
MAYHDQENYQPVFLPDWLPAEIAEEVYWALRAEAKAEGRGRPPRMEEPDVVNGYIVKGWFGPFLLGPQTFALRGRC